MPIFIEKSSTLVLDLGPKPDLEASIEISSGLLNQPELVVFLRNSETRSLDNDLPTTLSDLASWAIELRKIPSGVCLTNSSRMFTGVFRPT